MAIMISEKPIISMDTGKTLGTLKGFIYKNNKVRSLYCKLSDRYVDIPIKDACIGIDAIMLKSTEDINLFYADLATKVYTTTGKELGTLTSIETDDTFDITGITVDELYIGIDKVLHMEDIIIVANDITNTVDTIPTSIKSIVYTEVNDDLDDDLDDESEEQNDLIYNEISIEPSPNSTVQLSEYPIEEADLEDNKDNEITNEIDPRYNYLIGKKLLEDITIVKETYKKGSSIDPSLIEFAIYNNAIIKVIMNTEE